MNEAIFIGARSEPLAAAIVGSKAAELGRIARLGLPSPPAFVLPTSLCAEVVNGNPEALKAVRKGLEAGVSWLEAQTGRRLGDSRDPLLVSVRSGAEISMPGMLDTVLNVGMNADAAHGLIRSTGNPRLAFDSYRRFLQLYAEVVGGAPREPFDAALAAMIASEGVESEADLDSEAIERLSSRFRSLAEEHNAAPPLEPAEQLAAAARAVYLSWESRRAREYRRLNGLEYLAGTAVTVQAMAFGNAGSDSGAGVAFSRDPATAAPGLYVDFLFDAQGEDIVSGRRTPGGLAGLARRLPDAARALQAGAAALEKDCRDAQDMEFTIERGRLYFLQTRSAKRTPRAALKIAVDLVNEGAIDKSEALARLEGVDLAAARAARFSSDAPVVASAIAAAPGVACGRVCLTSEDAAQCEARGEPAILVRPDTSTEDVAGFAAASGILTAVGGRTSHAAVVARQMGKVCLVGCQVLVFSDDGARLAGSALNPGDWIALNGDSGEISLGRFEIVTEEAAEEAIVRRWRSGQS